MGTVRKLCNFKVLSSGIQILTRQPTVSNQRISKPAVTLQCRLLHQVNMNTESLEVKHDKEKCEFFIEMQKDANEGNPPKALLQYSWIKENIIDMHHTGVPVEFRGKGVAKLLAKDALDFAVNEDLQFYLTCTYLQKYVKDNPLPEYTKRLLQS